MVLDQDLVTFARQALLDVVKARYMDAIHTGKIGNSVMAAKILLYSVDVAQDHISRSLQDWQTIETALTPNPRTIATLRFIDDLSLRLFNRHSGFVGWLDAFNERNALYVLINYIDAHEHALDKLQFILGFEQMEDSTGGAGGSPGRDTFNTRNTGTTGTYLQL